MLCESPLRPLTEMGMLRHPRKSSVWSSVGLAVPFVRADLTICLKYLGTAGWTSRLWSLGSHHPHAPS